MQNSAETGSTPQTPKAPAPIKGSLTHPHARKESTMLNPTPRTDFGTLLARAWKLYAKALHITFPTHFICMALPVTAVLAVLYYGLVNAFEPALRIAQTMLRSLLENGFDEWALGNAMEQMMTSLGTLNPLEILLRAVGSIGLTALILLLLLPLVAVCRLLLTPIGRGASLAAHTAALRDQRPRFSDSFSALKKRFGRLMGLELLFLPTTALFIALAVLLCSAVSAVPTIGSAVKLIIALAAITVIGSLRHLGAMAALRQNLPVFRAYGYAFKRFFTDWTYLAAGCLFYACLFGGAVLILVADVFLMILAVLPPIAVVLYFALFMPLAQTIVLVMHQEQTRRAEGSLPQSPEK